MAAVISFSPNSNSSLSDDDEQASAGFMANAVNPMTSAKG